MPRRFLVIDGADQGQSFLLPDSGTVLVGNSSKHCDICLHDLYVSRVHCEVSLEGSRVLVSARETPGGTLVNGVKVVHQELQPGDVVRVGNSHLRLEEVDAAALKETSHLPLGQRSLEEGEKTPRLPDNRLGELSGWALGHFELGLVLGQGHSGVVFRAHDTKKDQDVALKVLSASFPADEEEMKHFIQVIRQVLPLRHPNLVGLQGAGKIGPYVWLAKDLIEGDDLSVVIGRAGEARKIKWRPALRLALHIGQALEFIHRERLVHGNITPKNILLPAEEGPAKLNDLGLQKALQGSLLLQRKQEENSNEEMPYLSPEHLDPELPVDELADQYCLGAAIYALLTGQPPFTGKTPEKLRLQIRQNLPEKPKYYQRAIPDELQAAALRMLAKRPEDRYPTSAVLLAELERIAAEHGVNI